MNRKILFTVAIAISTSFASYSQKVKLKKGKVLVDGKEILKYEKRALGSEITLYNLKDNNEIAEMYLERNGTNNYQEDDYRVMFFSESEIKVESSRVRTRGWKYIVKLLIQNKALDLNGELNTEKLKKFAKKYDENITNRTIRY